MSLRIVVVDDDEITCRVLARLLVSEGHVVDVRSSGSSALERLREGPCDLLLTDLVMPGMDGVQLIAAACALAPALRCIVMSGHARPPGAPNDVIWLNKPIDIDRLLELIGREELGPNDAVSSAKMKKQLRNVREVKDATRRHQHEAEGGLGGAIAGAAVGAIAGPPGAVAGAVIGGLIGALAVGAVEQDLGDRAAADRQLDADIGVSGGDMGAPNLLHPPAIRGVYSAESAGASSGGHSSSSEGPLQTPES